MFRKFLLSAALIAAGSAATAGPINYSEGFEDITSLAGAGWVFSDNSTPGGDNPGWFQGNSGVFAAESGSADSYIAANFLGAPIGGSINNWLITPVFSVVEGSVVSFSTRTADLDFGDNLEVLFSYGSSNLADFTSLGTILSSDYPIDWTTVGFSSSGYGDLRLAFRYFVPDTTSVGDYIGIDSFSVKGDVANVPEPGTIALFGVALFMMVAATRRRREQI